MNQQTVGELIYKISGDMDNLQVALKKSEADINQLKDAMTKTTDAAKKSEKGFGSLGKAIKALGLAYLGSKILQFGRASLDLATQRIEQETKLAQVLRISRNATDEQIQALNDQAEALEKVGVIGRDVITSAQAQLATFDLSADAIQRLTPSVIDYVAAEKGANATREDAKALANGLAQALQGNFTSLTRTGFVLDETTKQLISNGTEMERAAALASVLDSTYQDVNKTLAGTFLGTQARVSNAFEDLKTDLGFALIPAVQVLAKELLGITGQFGAGVDRINSWGKALYRVAQAVVALIQGFKQMANVVKIAFNGIQNTFLGGAIVILEASKKIAQVLGKDTELIDGALQSLQESFDSNLGDIENAIDDSIKNGEAFNKAMNEVIDPKGFEAATSAAIAAYDAARKGNEAFGSSVEDTTEDLKKFNEGIESTAAKSVEARRAIEEDLNSAITDFGKNVRDNTQETATGLAKIVADAEGKIKDLQAQLSTTNDPNQSADLQKQIKEQQDVIASRVGFEQRQAEQIAAIRAKLAAAGIDADKAGLGEALKVRDIEKELEEQRRLSTLNEFQLFEETQNKKLEKLADDFIAEVKIMREKYEMQVSLEQSATSFLESEQSKRLDSTKEWAQGVIAEYGKVADSLRNLFSAQEQLRNAGVPSRVSPIAPSPASTSSGAASPAGGTTTNNRSTTVNAPVTINGGVEGGLKPGELSAILGFELSRFMK